MAAPTEVISSVESMLDLLGRIVYHRGESTAELEVRFRRASIA